MGLAMRFNQLDYIKQLESAGTDRKVAEIQARALNDVYEDISGELAKKSDLNVLEARFKQEISEAKADVIEKLSAKIDSKFTWIIGIVIAQPAILISILKIMHVSF